EEILEKLVALNADRAEEERNGLVRWLRPDFQNPTGAQKPTELTLPGTEEATSGGEAVVVPTVSVWPKAAGERIKALRDLVFASKRLWSTREIVAAFKGAKK